MLDASGISNEHTVIIWALVVESGWLNLRAALRGFVGTVCYTLFPCVLHAPPRNSSSSSNVVSHTIKPKLPLEFIRKAASPMNGDGR